MKKLSELIDCKYDIDIESVYDDSRTKAKNGLFVAVKGITVDGSKYVENAVENGAVAVICEHEIDALVPCVVVKDCNVAYNQIMSRLYDEPDKKMNIIGVTGTDGKTTTAEILYQLAGSKAKCGYIGTNGIRSEGYTQENEYTTPLPKELYKAFNGFYKDKCEFVMMEASGERLGTHKLDGLMFDASIYTNLSRDQLNLFTTMENYAYAKARLFENTKSDGICIINVDDEYSDIMISRANARVITIAIDKEADVMAENIDCRFGHLEYDIKGIYGKHHIVSNISGKFNVYNLTSALVCLVNMGYSIDALIEAISRIVPIEARQTIIDEGQDFTVIVDYAHMANAIKNLVNYVRPITKGRVVTVIGAGGSRDINRRVDVANYCTQNVDYSYFTIEDPRYEDPQMLLDTMVKGLAEKGYTNYETQIDRDKAITDAIQNAKEDDCILILGKGNEEYMIVKGIQEKRLSDIELAHKVLKKLNSNQSKNI